MISDPSDNTYARVPTNARSTYGRGCSKNKLDRAIDLFTALFIRAGTWHDTQQANKTNLLNGLPPRFIESTVGESLEQVTGRATNAALIGALSMIYDRPHHDYIEETAAIRHELKLRGVETPVHLREQYLHK